MDNPSFRVAGLLHQLAGAYLYDDEGLKTFLLNTQLQDLAGILLGEKRMSSADFREDWGLCPHGQPWWEDDCDELCAGQNQNQ